ncbi:MAG: hypothetical protein EXS15_06635, partial [Phycisphaerales bacterium]|nr:hypothetical protein [Phycisphaerales bacterium]
MTPGHSIHLVSRLVVVAFALLTPCAPLLGQKPATNENATTSPQAKRGSQVAVIPLAGQVGVGDGDSDQWFNAADFNGAVAKAEKDGATTIILNINSPGGRVDTETEIIKTILLRGGHGIHFVAFIN